jgi:hypothetical protein
MKPDPCFICKSTKRERGQEWQAACPDCRPIQSICCTSVDDARSAIASASDNDLSRAFQYENSQRSPRRTLLDKIRLEIARRTKARKP